MRKLLLLLTVMIGLITQVLAQSRQVSGKVTDDKGNPVAGASVTIKDSKIGTTTKEDGSFSFSVPADTKALVVSGVGFIEKSASIGNGVVNVALENDDKKLVEVVVTALGMKKDKKSLGYATQEIKTADLTRTGNANLATAMQGKLAGVEIKPSSGMPGASSQIVIRGARSFTGNNTPLYVIDGMPVSTTSDFDAGNGGAGVSGTDVANRSIDIDPNDIESINVLKGQAASAIYGTRASNGVVIITTKSGKGLQVGKPVITVSNYSNIDKVSRKPNYQSTWAQGTVNAAGVYSFDPNNSASWGPKISDLPNDPKYGGNTNNTYTNGDLETHKGMYYVPQRASAGLDPWAKPQAYDNFGGFFKTGTSTNTSLNISQAMKGTNYSFGLANVEQKGIVPNTSMERYNAKGVAEIKVNDLWKTGFSANYAHSYIKKAPSANDGSLATVYATPRNYDLNGIPSENSKDPYTQILYRKATFNNPYWSANHNLFDEKTDRVFGNTFIEFVPIISKDNGKKLSFRYQLGVDAYTTHLQDINEYGSKTGTGSVDLRGITSTTWNSLLTANYSMDLTHDLKLTALLGNEINDRNQKLYEEYGTSLNFGGWPQINNATVKNADESKYRNRTVGVFGNVGLAYKDMLFLNVTGRNDIVSTMPSNNRSFFYPSFSAGFVLTQLNGLKGNDVLSFAKLRASYAEVGQPGSYYNNYYTTPSYTGGWWTDTHIQYPLGGKSAYIPNNVIYDPQLKPQNTISYEGGIDLKFLNNRIGLEYTFSRQNVKDQIFQVPLAASTGSAAQVMNGGSIHTNVHEIVLTANAIETRDFDWNLNFNFSKIQNYVDKLAPGVESIFLGGFVTPQVRAGIGYTFPVIYGTAFARDEQGRILVDDKGLPMAGAPNVIGVVSPKFTLGGGTSLRWKKLLLATTFDWKNGGQMYSGTNGLLMYNYGLDKTSEDRSTPFTYAGYTQDGKVNDILRGGENDKKAYYDLASRLGTIDEAAIFKSSFVKMRELSLSYKFSKVYKTLDINVSVFARNILLWTNYPNLDPETSQGNTNMAGSFERFSLPQTKSFGLGVNLVF
ncbi:SusC/RagA family TonB-linked outer membrane protein [Pinibacter soli]|uniref:SusC/RagA family TonB-linked outer membrane protein n=1 Tax=Pinibacter soli TaxID=3044211 RepID=A0ABT6R788_9BACT|nr:SusC/RagA family TonB-linked outer membrane protein [Pinibacter soli]MDI3318430.1 SusC/RagA family TonB-linked outer membrane protein [Pinibacter soli]